MKKLYYSISEISEIADLKKYVIRFWETEFSNLQPKKNKAGNRIYKKEDLELILKIKDLLYNHHYTIKGAKKVLKKNSTNSNTGAISNIQSSSNDCIDVLNNLREKIKNLLSEVESLD